PTRCDIDADIELADRTLVRRAVEKMRRKQLHCLTTNISCPLGSLRAIPGVPSAEPASARYTLVLRIFG
ncbi:MAG TPA: hypothetical protein VI424_10385, partial [Terriglobales bacterium]